VSRDFLIQVFSRIIFPQAPENNMRVFLNFFENSQKYRSQGAPPVSTTLGANFRPVLTTQGANLLPVSMTPCGKFAAGVNNSGGKKYGNIRMLTP
jgi:hypothetical protein